jgi:phosphatidylglycerophosphate synthase
VRDRWTLVHSLAMLVLAGVALALSAPLVVALGGAVSLAIFAANHRGRFTPRGPFGVANAITALRIGLVIALSAVGRLGPFASLIVLCSFALDGLDGAVARRRGDDSAFGAAFDMETDALLVLVAGLVLALRGSLGAFIIVPGLLRYAYAAAVALAPSVGEEPRSRLGRSAFSVMVISLAVSLWPVEPVSKPLAIFATALIVLSFGRSTYFSFFRGSSRARR